MEKTVRNISFVHTQENGIFSHAIETHNRHSVVKLTQKEMEFFSGVPIHVMVF